ncbi:retinol-binding protein pinta [Anabrus simplex]|uniref:retinol-binding protein pinta n=1 Tax=Anabrus simplex TaxID=316456 RepID=UPI0034DD210A
MEEKYHCTLPEEVKKYAAEILHETEGDRDWKIEKMRAWLETQPHLNARKDVMSILRFLRGCKYDLTKAQFKMTNFYEMRAKVPEWFSQRDPTLQQLQELLTIGVFLPLRHPDPEGRLVCIIRAAAHNPHVHLQNDVFKIGKMILDLAVEEDISELSSVYGVVAIFDLNGVTLAHALQMTPAVIKKAVHAWQDCYPLRTRRLDFINAPIYVNVILNIFRKFMREKLRKRIQIHRGGLGNLHKVIPPEILPHEYGGTDGPLSDLVDYWKQHLLEKRDWFLEDEKYKADVPG